jgi:hypothetical protein
MLRKLLKIIFRIALCLLLLAFVYYLAKSNHWLPETVFAQIESKIPTITLPWNKDAKLELSEINYSQEDLEKLGADGLKQVKTLTDKAKDVGEIAQDFVEEVVQVDASDSSKNVSEKAFEYGRYIYCQEVVKQYEASKAASF